jgi:hypothetical protein
MPAPGDTGIPGEQPTVPGEPVAPPLDGKKPVTCDPAQAAVGSARLWRLTREQLDNTLSVLTGETSRPFTERLPAEVGVHGFFNNAEVLHAREAEVAQINIIARQVADTTVRTRLESVLPCAASQAGDAACRDAFITEFGQRAFRRPLGDPELARYRTLYDQGVAKGDGLLGVTVTLEAMLQSPAFLFRSELGGSAGKARLTGPELATALAYGLTNYPPDAELTAAALAGDLSADDKVVAQARRLFALPAARNVAAEFMRQLFAYPFLPTTQKIPELFPTFDPLKPHMLTEAGRFFEHLLFEDGGRLETLLTASYTFANAELAPLYGLAAAGAAFEQITLPRAERSGALTLSGVMATLAVDNRTSPVARGKFVREMLLCEQIPDPPGGVDISLPALDPGLSARQQLEARTTDPACAACHSLMNPLGFAFESLDSIGQFRTEENGLPLDTQASLTGTLDADGPFADIVELGQRLSTSEQVRQCMAINSFRYTLGRMETAADACSVVELKQKFSATDHDLRELLLATFATEAFLYRNSAP